MWPKRGWMASLARFAVTTVLLLLLLGRVKLGESLRIVGGADALQLCLALLLMGCNHVMMGFNLTTYADAFGKRGRLRQALVVHYITNFFSFTGLGETVGTLVRYGLLDQIPGTGRFTSQQKVAILLAEKVLSASVTLALSVVLLACFARDECMDLAGMVRVRPVLGGTLLAFVGAFAAVGLVLGFRHQTQDYLFDLWKSIYQIFRKPWVLPILLGRNVLMLLNAILIMQVVLQSIHISSLGLGALVALYTIVYLSQFVPFTIGGLGVRENAVVYAMGFFGVAAEQSLAFAVVCLLLSAIHSVCGAALFLGARGKTSQLAK